MSNRFKTMKIAMIGQKGIPAQYGGIEKHVEALAVRLGSVGHEVLVYTRGWFASPQQEYSKGVHAVFTPTIHTKHMDAIVHTFTSTIHAIRSGVDVIHYHGVGPSLVSWIPRIFAPRIKVVSTFHCIDRKHQKWNPFARFMLWMGEMFACLFPHQTIAVSKLLQTYCKRYFSRKPVYIPNGFCKHSNATVDDQVLTQLGLVSGEYIVMVSRLVRHKGAHYLIKAYKELERQGRTLGKKCVIVGGSAFTDDYIDELHQLATNDNNIIFTGYRTGKELDSLFANSYLVVHPSESEGLPLSVLDAMSYGKTVLASDIPENLEVTKSHGISFCSGNVQVLTKEHDLLLHSPDFVASLGEEAQKFVSQNYNWDAIAQSVEGVYQSLVPMSATV